MSAVLLFLCTASLAAQNVFKKQYNSKVKEGVYGFNAISGFFALLFFLIPGVVGEFDFRAGLTWYAIFYAISYVVTLVGIYLAFSWGGFGISSLIFSYATMLPTLFAILFLNEKMTSMFAVGLFCLIISLFLTNAKVEKSEKLSARWVIAIALAFLGNGICAIIQNVQQVAYEGACKNEFMTLALLIVEIVLWSLVFIFERPHIKTSLMKGTVPAAACGISNGATNLLVMVMLGLMPASVLFPVISAGGIMISFVFSVFVYKENYNLRQKIGVLFGIAAIVLLNL